MLRRTVAIVVVLNCAYFFIEIGVARSIGSVSLYADSVDFLEDASINALVLIAMGLGAAWRRASGFLFAGFLLVPSVAALWTAWAKLQGGGIADPARLALTAIGALLINGLCAYLLARVRHARGSLSKAAFLSARNDVIANMAMIGAGGVTAVWPSIWPDLVVGLAIALLNLGAAWEVAEAALKEADPEAKGE